MRFGRALLVALALAYGFAVGCATVHAAGLDEAIAHFTTDDFDETLTGIKEVAASGNPRAEIIIGALQTGQLMFSAERKAVYIQDSAGKLTDAATGEPVAGAPPADLDTVNINNRLRGAIAAALGQLTLLSNDPQKRYEAAHFCGQDQMGRQERTKQGGITIPVVFGEARLIRDVDAEFEQVVIWRLNYGGNGSVDWILSAEYGLVWI